MPTGDFNATANIGTQNGTAGTGTLPNLQLLIGTNGTGNDFGVLLPSSLAGYSYVDANGNGTFDAGETPLAGVSIALAGTDDLGNPVSQSATTAADGSYSFTGLRPGTYSLSETRRPAMSPAPPPPAARVAARSGPERSREST